MKRSFKRKPQEFYDHVTAKLVPLNKTELLQFMASENPIYPLNVAYLNYGELQKDAVKRIIASAIDKIMTKHKEHKGIIHTTSYEQLNFIREHVSKDNRGFEIIWPLLTAPKVQ